MILYSSSTFETLINPSLKIIFLLSCQPEPLKSIKIPNNTIKTPTINLNILILKLKILLKSKIIPTTKKVIPINIPLNNLILNLLLVNKLYILLEEFVSPQEEYTHFIS
jgi:hypothetical protein